MTKNMKRRLLVFTQVGYMEVTTYTEEEAWAIGENTFPMTEDLKFDELAGPEWMFQYVTVVE